jgi:hypothetical protein
MFGVLLYLPTIALIPHFAFIFPLVYLLIKSKGDFTDFRFNWKKVDFNIIIITSICLLSLLNKLIFYQNAESIFDLIPYTTLIFLSLFYAKRIDVFNLKVLIFLIFIESISVIVEYLIGINTFIPGIEDMTNVMKQHSNEFYYSRPYGFSNNSSVIAYKILLAYLLMDFLNLKSKIHYAIRIIFLVAIFLTFSRTIFLTLLLYIFLNFSIPFFSACFQLLKLRIKKSNLNIVIMSIILLAFGSVLIIKYLDKIISQLTRNKGIDLSGRDEIWSDFFDFINSNWIFGNGSYKYEVEYYSGFIHAHNSFIQTLANNGIIITSLFLFLILFNLRRNNLLYIFTLIVYSLFQYGIFWGISLLDIILFVFLIRVDSFQIKTINKQKI